MKTHQEIVSHYDVIQWSRCVYIGQVVLYCNRFINPLAGYMRKTKYINAYTVCYIQKFCGEKSFAFFAGKVLPWETHETYVSQ